jgi:hypothetical protein
MEASGPTVTIREEDPHVDEPIEVFASGVRRTRCGLGDLRDRCWLPQSNGDIVDPIERIRLRYPV